MSEFKKLQFNELKFSQLEENNSFDALTKEITTFNKASNYSNPEVIKYLRKILKTLEITNSLKADLYLELIKNLSFQYKIKEGITVCDEAASFFNHNISNPLQYLSFHNFYMVFLNVSSRHQETINYGQIVLNHKWEEDVKISLLIGQINKTIGTAYFKLSLTDTALKYLNKTVEIFKKLDDKNSLARAYLDIGNLYLENKEYYKSIGFYKEALSIFETKKDYIHLSICKVSLASALIELKEYKKANQCIQSSIKIAKENHFKPQLFYAFICRAEFFLRQNLVEKYFESENDILKFKDFLSTQMGGITADFYRIKGAAHYAKKEYIEALEALEKAEHFEMESKSNLVLEKVINLKIKVLKELNLKDELIVHFEKLLIVKEALLNESKQKAIQEFEIKYENEKKELEIKTLKLNKTYWQLKTLRAQMNPHFVFNAINSITNTMNEQTIAHSKKLLCSFARLMRANLDFADREFISLEEEITFLKDYLALEKSRLGDNLNYNIIFDENLDIDFIDIPSMILQPYVENAVKHGIMPLTEDGKITIKFEEQDNNILQCTVEDNGVGRAKASKTISTHESKSSKITAARLKLIFKNPDKFNVKFIDLKDKNNKACGTKVVILIPIE